MKRIYAFEFVAFTLVIIAVISVLNSSRLIHTAFEDIDDHPHHQSPLDQCRATQSSFGTFFSDNHLSSSFKPLESYGFNTSVSWPLSNPVISPPLIVQPRQEEEEEEVENGATPSTVTIDAIANPFLYTTNNSTRLYLFFEAHKCSNTLVSISNSNQQQQPHKDIFIAGAESTDGGITWHHFPSPVLTEQRLLRHPFVFEYKSHHYMVVDADDDAQVILYRATSQDEEHPASLSSSSTTWHYHDTILNKPLTQISIVYHPLLKTWFMLGSRPKTSSISSISSSTTEMMMLDIHMASSPLGPWTRHPASPYIPLLDSGGGMVWNQFVISTDQEGTAQVWRVGKVLPSNTLSIQKVTLTEDEYIEEEGGESLLVERSSNREGVWDWQGFDSITMVLVDGTGSGTDINIKKEKHWAAVVSASTFVSTKVTAKESLMVMWYCNVALAMLKILAVVVASLIVLRMGTFVRSCRSTNKKTDIKLGPHHRLKCDSVTTIRASFGQDTQSDIETGGNYDDSYYKNRVIASSAAAIKRISTAGTRTPSPSSYDKKKNYKRIGRATRRNKEEGGKSPKQAPATSTTILISVIKMVAMLFSCALFIGAAHLGHSGLELASPFLLHSPYGVPVPVNGEYSKFTLMVQSYEARLSNLKLYIDHYSKCPSVGEILVVYNGGGIKHNNTNDSSSTMGGTAQDILEQISPTDGTGSNKNKQGTLISTLIENVLMYVLNGRRNNNSSSSSSSRQGTAARQSSQQPLFPNIRVRIEGTNSMNNRYKPDPLIRLYRGVLSLDDDLILPCQDVEYAFSQWRKQPTSLVGFFPRLVDNNDRTTNATGSTVLQYHGEPYATEHGQYTLILSGAAFLDAWTYFPLYWSDEMKSARELVDEVFNCDDILFNFIVHKQHYNSSKAAVEFVRPERRLDLSGLSGVGISHQSGKFIKTANMCLNRFVEIFGGNPLRSREFEVGWKRPECNERRNALDCAWL